MDLEDVSLRDLYEYEGKVYHAYQSVFDSRLLIENEFHEHLIESMEDLHVHYTDRILVLAMEIE